MSQDAAREAVFSDFEPREWEFLGVRRRGFMKGEGPGILLMHEVPGLTPDMARLARDIAKGGFRVCVPELFGELGKPFSIPYSGVSIAKACVSQEFSLLAKNASSPIIQWLRPLCQELHEECGGRGIGAVGLCLTGNFALSLMVEPSVMAPVLSQPSLPFAVSPSHAAALHVSPEDLAKGKERAEAQDLQLLGLRFSHDAMCPRSRFDHLQREFGERFVDVTIDSSFGNPHGLCIAAHSVLGVDFNKRPNCPTVKALETTLDFFRRHLQA